MNPASRTITVTGQVIQHLSNAIIWESENGSRTTIPQNAIAELTVDPTTSKTRLKLDKAAANSRGLA